MALHDWQLKPKVIPGDHESWGSTPREGRGGEWGALSQQFEANELGSAGYITQERFSLTEWASIQALLLTPRSRHRPTNYTYQCLHTRGLVIAQSKSGQWPIGKNWTLILTEHSFSRCLSLMCLWLCKQYTGDQVEVLTCAKFNQFQKVAGVISNSTLYLDLAAS